MTDSFASTQDTARVQPGAFLTLHYRLSGATGDVVNTFGGKPSTLTLGMGELAPALEEKIIGLAEGERASFALPAGAAFSERNPELVQWVSRKLLSARATRTSSTKWAKWWNFPPPMAKAATPVPWCRCARMARCCLTSTTRWPASR